KVPGSIGPYLEQAARRSAIDALRQLGREVPWSPERDAEMDGDFLDPERAQKEQETAEKDLRKVLASLTTQDREVISMRFLERMSLTQIAAREGVSYAAAGQRLSRALRRARARLLKLRG